MKGREEFIRDSIADIVQLATRHKRATDEWPHLITDLERIEQICERMLMISLSAKEYYSDEDIERIHLKEFSDGLDFALKNQALRQIAEQIASKQTQ